MAKKLILLGNGISYSLRDIRPCGHPQINKNINDLFGWPWGATIAESVLRRKWFSSGKSTNLIEASLSQLSRIA